MNNIVVVYPRMLKTRGYILTVTWTLIAHSLFSEGAPTEQTNKPTFFVIDALIRPQDNMCINLSSESVICIV